MPVSHPTHDPLLTSLASALAAHGSPWAGVPLERLRDKGLAHDHVRLCGMGALARIPKQSQMHLGAVDNLAYQKACFERAAPGGHAPRLFGVLPPGAFLPRGALLVEDIVGRNAALPADLGHIVQALASIHGLPLPAVAQRHPLINAPDPLRALHDEIADQSQHLAVARLDSLVAAAIAQGIASLQTACAGLKRPPRHLIAFDGHPGNFIVREDSDGMGEAVLVDLEKCRYSYPGLDLAHATLYTSTTWDLDSHAVLSLPQVTGAYQTWADSMDPTAAEAARPWHVPLRRAMWLWSITWCAKWRVLSAAPAPASPDGEDWSAALSGDALIRHVRGRVDHYLSAAVVNQVREEFELLDAALNGVG